MHLRTWLATPLALLASLGAALVSNTLPAQTNKREEKPALTR